MSGAAIGLVVSVSAWGEEYSPHRRCFGKAVETWIECFGRNNVVVLNITDYFSDPNMFMRRVQEFVGLPPLVIPPPKNRTNENPIEAPPPSKQAIAKLQDFFTPYDDRLWQVIGERFEW